jgi:hypothetical protein
MQELVDRIFEFPPRGQTYVNRGDATVAIDQISARQSFDAAILIVGLIVANHHTIIHFVFFEKRLHDFPALVVLSDAENGKALILLVGLELGKPGDFHLARTAPGGPEIEDHYFTPVIAKVNQTAVDVLQGEVGRWFATGVSLQPAACTDGLRTRGPAEKHGSGKQRGDWQGFSNRRQK